MNIDEFGDRLVDLTYQFQLKENWVDNKNRITHHKETVISDELIDLMSKKPDAIKQLLYEFSKVKGCESLRDVLDCENINVGKKAFDGGNDIPDIIISLGNNEKNIFIENKIHAVDQPNQLWRYFKHKPQWLFYLTRFGHKASDDSESESYNENKEGKRTKRKLICGEDYFCVSYYEHIYHWLLKLKETDENDPHVNKLLVWVLESFVNSPELFELILQNKKLVKDIFYDEDKKFDEKYDTIRNIIRYGCGLGDNNMNNSQGFVRFNNFIIWTKLFPALDKFADEHGCKFIVSDRFEFKESKKEKQYFEFCDKKNSSKTVRFELSKRKYKDTWNGVSLDEKLLNYSRWDFWTLLDYEDKVLNEIKEKVDQRLLMRK